MDQSSFVEWIDRYHSYMQMRNYSEKTIQSYIRVVRLFGAYLVDRGSTFDQVGAADDRRLITGYLSNLSQEHGYSAKTLHRIISTLSSFYRFLYAQGAVAVNPLTGIDRPKIKRQELRYLKHRQVLKLIESMPSVRDQLIVRMIYATGVRVSELCGIAIEHIDFDDLTIRIQGKGDKIRTVFIDEETCRLMEVYAGERIFGPFFVGQQGHPLSPRTVQHLFEVYAPPGVTPHTIRHSYASELYKRSKNLRVVQENLGHSSIKTTEIYLHTDLDERQGVYRTYFPLSKQDGSES
jgi:site-specific recombinase XerD